MQAQNAIVEAERKASLRYEDHMIPNRAPAGLSDLKLLAKAKFTPDMVLNLKMVLDQNDSVDVEFREWGVWAVTEHGTRLFIGSTDLRPGALAVRM